MRRYGILGVILVILAVATLADGQTALRGRGPQSASSAAVGASRACRGLVDALALTTAQQSGLETLRQQTAESTRAIAEQIHTLRESIDAALESGADRCAIGDLEIQAHGLREQIETLRTTAATSFLATLTAEQRASYDSFIAANPDCSAAAIIGLRFGGPEGRG